MKKIKKSLRLRKSVSIVVLFMMAFSAVGMIGFVDLSKGGSFPTPPESGLPDGEEEPSGGDGGNPPDEGEASNPGIPLIPPPIEEPDVTSAYASSITSDSAVVHGYLSDDGGEACDCRFNFRPIVPNGLAQQTGPLGPYDSPTSYSYTFNQANIHEWEWCTCAHNSEGSDCTPWKNFLGSGPGGSNHPPVATDDSYSVNKGETYTAVGSDDISPIIIVYKSSLILPPLLPNGVLENDEDPDGDTLVAHLISGPSHASSFTLELNGGFTYTHNGDDASSDSFVYEANDRRGGTDTATVSLSITEAESIDDYFTVEKNSADNQFDVLVNDIFGFDGRFLITDHRITSIGTPPSHGTAYINEDLIYYTPNSDYSGPDEFTYVAIKAWSTGLRDDPGVVYSATVYVTVGLGNLDPVANDDLATVDKGDTITQLDDGASSVLDNDNDDDGDSLTANWISGPSHASSFNLNSDGSFSYTHDGSETISDSFTYEADDGNGGTDTATVSITVSNNNNPPTAKDDSATVNEGETVKIDVSDNDEDLDDGLDLSSIKIKNPPNYGSVYANSDGAVDYIHDGSEISSDSFTYTIKDKSGQESNEAAVFVTINLVTDKPGKPSIQGGVQSCYTEVTYAFESILADAGTNAKYYFYWDNGEELPDPNDPNDDKWKPLPSSDRPLTLTLDYEWNNAGVYDVKVAVIDPDSDGTITAWSLPFPVQVLHKSENPEDG